MRYLLDSCAFLWILGDDPALSEVARAAYADPDNEVYLSAASIWEILVKHRLGRLTLPEPADEFLREQRERHLIRELPIDEMAVLQLPKLPDHHKDPFDRLLICQAVAEGLVILTPDPWIRRYPVRTLW